MLSLIIKPMKLMFWPTLRLEWVQFAALAVSAAGAAMSYSGGKKAEKAQQDAAEYQAALAKDQYRLQKESIAAAQEEAKSAAANDLHDTTVAFMKQRASVIAGAGEAGVAGGSVTRTIVDSAYQEQATRGRHMSALESYMAKSGRDLKGAAIGMSGAMARDYKGVSNTTLALQSGLNFASSALSIDTSHKAAGGAGIFKEK